RQAARVCSTRFQPENWNIDPIQRRNNCYNYATNIQTNTFAQPGRASGRRYRENVGGEVYSACLRDGLTGLRAPDAGTECLIALVVWPGEDYHFYRLDNNGYWSHKSGRTEARNTDDSGDPIIDPRTADRGPYSDFVGWLGVGPRARVN
nr:RecName: Full=Insoluble matrix shell protein 1; Short=IMSP1 [Ruditapes philippinarum]